MFLDQSVKARLAVSLLSCAAAVAGCSGVCAGVGIPASATFRFFLLEAAAAAGTAARGGVATRSLRPP